MPSVGPTGENPLNERGMVGKLAVQLAPRCRRVLVHQNLAGLAGFKAELVRRCGFLPVLNEIDMILVGPQGELCAIEVKCFSVRNGAFTRPFYDGIGQSLSLLRYGFEFVALWHLFPGSIDQARFDRYGAAAWWFIRNQLQLPLDFSYFKVSDDPVTPQFIVMQYDSPSTGAQLIPIDSANFVLTWRHDNPFAQTEEARDFRKALVAALGIGGIVSSEA